MSYRLLQASLAILGVVAVVGGIVQIAGGAGPLPGDDSVPESIDSEIRFLSVFWLALGGTALWLAPRAREYPAVVRAVAAALFLGGIARVISWISVGKPDDLLIVPMVLELTVAPLLLGLQALAGPTRERR